MRTDLDATVSDRDRSVRQSEAGRRWGRRVGRAVVVILAILLGVQLIASPIAKAVLNRKLASLPGYQGEVGAVRVALWKAGVELDDFVLRERDHRNDPPPVRVKRVSTRFAWKPLLRGRLAGEIKVDGAETTIIKRQRLGLEGAAEKIEQKTEAAKREIEPWRETLRKTFPIEISRLEMKNGKARFIDRSHQPHVDIAAEELTLIATGLRNKPDGEALPAKVEVTGVTTGGGKMKINIEADPLAKPPHFKSTMELKELSLPPLNPFLLAYADADVSRGTFEFYLEVTAEKGGYHGYTKPFIKDVDFENPSDKEKPVAKRLTESAADMVTSVLKNDDEDKVATKAPFSGTFETNEVDVWTTVANLLRNAFIEALKEGFEGGGGK